MRAHLHAPAPRLRAVAGVSPALDRVVARAVAKPPAQRWQTAAAMAQALAVATGQVKEGAAPGPALAAAP
jgi:serine/threonine-protein kinase